MSARRSAVVAGGIAVLLALVFAASRWDGGAADSGDGDFSMLSMPDFLNADIADLSDARFWKPGDPNGINATYERGFRVVMEDLDRWDVTDVLIAGDLVEGHWGRDDLRTGIFGPVGTEAQRVEAMGRAARQYYTEHLARFTSRGMRVHAAVGDHEIGDDYWSATGSSYDRFKHRHIADFKALWARYLTDSGTRYPDHPNGTPHDDTAYSVRLDPEVLLVTVDTFERTKTNVSVTISGGQMDWLEETLAAANAEGIDWIIVQGHNPVAGPVRFRHSSNIMYEGGIDSEFWQVMKRYDVDLYLAGEVHDTTAIVPVDGGPVQISHGGLFYNGEFSYMLCRFEDDRLQLTTRAFRSEASADNGFIWQTDRDRILPGTVTYQPGSFVTGAMTLDKDDGVIERSGMLDVYEPIGDGNIPTHRSHRY